MSEIDPQVHDLADVVQYQLLAAQEGDDERFEHCSRKWDELARALTARLRTPGTVEVDGVVAEIARERIHQIQDNGFDARHDDAWTDGELVNAAICYVQSDFDLNRWPWDEEWWKDKGERQNLIRGIALLVAEVERRDRAALAKEDTNDTVQ